MTTTPTHTRRAVVADDDRDTREFLNEALTRQGWSVTASATGHGLVEACRKSKPDLIVTDIRMPDMDGLDAIAAVNNGGAPIPSVIVSAHHDDALLARTAELSVLGYLVKPFTEAQLKSAITVAMNRAKQFAALREEADGLRQALADRKLIERAKGILMHRLSVDEDEAFRRLRSAASSGNQKLVEAARKLIAAEEVFSEFGR
jgi:response regulator NasT